jgi:hypothetical protein
MYLTHRQVANLDKAGLLEFFSRAIPEGHHIDYKQALSGNTRTKQFSEFLKDTRAFANANGGHHCCPVNFSEATISYGMEMEYRDFGFFGLNFPWAINQ